MCISPKHRQQKKEASNIRDWLSLENEYNCHLNSQEKSKEENMNQWIKAENEHNRTIKRLLENKKPNHFVLPSLFIYDGLSKFDIIEINKGANWY